MNILIIYKNSNFYRTKELLETVAITAPAENPPYVETSTLYYAVA
jgi:hypothetical protein